MGVDSLTFSLSPGGSELALRSLVEPTADWTHCLGVLVQSLVGSRVVPRRVAVSSSGTALSRIGWTAALWVQSEDSYLSAAPAFPLAGLRERESLGQCPGSESLAPCQAPERRA